MTLSEACEIFAYWEHNPPGHLMLQAIARMLGWAPSQAGPVRVSDAGTIANAPPPGLAVVHGPVLGMPPLLDVEALRARNQARAVEIARRGSG